MNRVEDGPKISLLSPVYNEEAHLAEMLESLRIQSFECWELLIVDDGSTDGTLGIATEAARRDPRIKIVSTGVKLGKVKAFNTAFAASTGDVVAIMGGDDVMPPGSLATRVEPFVNRTHELLAAFYKIRMFSLDSKFDGVVLPRGPRGSRSGPSITFSRPLAEKVFPIPAALPSEDIWLGEALDILARAVVESPDVVVNYRVHAGNSNPRNKSFEQMTESIHVRMAAWNELLMTDRFEIGPEHRKRLDDLVHAEELRYQGRTLRLLGQPGVRPIDRLAMASMSRASLWKVRTRFYKFLSGRRGR